MIRSQSFLFALTAVGAITVLAKASDYSDLVQSHGPVAYWRLGETSGTTAVDTTSAHNGTYQNSVTLGVTGAFVGDSNTAPDFAGGANDRVQVNPFGVSGTGITILAWFKPNGFGDDRFVAKSTSTASTDHYWALGLDSSSRLSAYLKINGTTQYRTPTVSGMATGVWCFAALTYDGSTMRTYLNGVQVDGLSTAGTLSTDSTVAVALGNLPSGAGNRAYNGVLDEVAVFDKGLSAAQIYELYITGGGGLLAHWKLVETSGTTATDSSSQQNDGSYNNGVVLGSAGPYPGAGAKAANFDGTNDHVAIPTESKYDLTGPMAVAAWIKVDLFDEAEQAIVTKGNNAWRLQRDGSNNGLNFYCESLSTNTIASSVNINDGQWHHAVGVYTGSQLQIYIDGVLSNSVNSSGSIHTNDRAVRIGQNAQGAARSFDGAIHDVRIYSRGLSASEVAKLYGLIGHWKLNQTTGSTANDSSPFARNGTVNGIASWSTRCNGAGVFDFDGSTNHINIADAAHLRPTTAMTIAGWVKGDSWGADTDVDVILRKGEGDPNNYQLSIANSRVGLNLDNNDNTGVAGNTALIAGQWYHVAGMWDGTTVRIYVNGALDASAARSGTIATDTRALYIGGHSGADLFDGQMQDVRFFNRSLNNAELAKISGTVGNWQFAEGTGTTTADSSLLANNATLSGATWTTDCAGHNALEFNGSGGFASTNSAFTPPDEGTVAFWMRSSGSPASIAGLFGTGGDWEVRQSTDGKLNFDISGEAGTNAVSTVPLNEAGHWYHIAETYNSADDSYAIYIDGKLDTSGTNTNNLVQQAAAVLTFGTRTGSTEYWQGALRDFRVYSRRLCPSEIAELYGLVGYWALDESSGSTASDSSGAGNHGTVVGTANWNAGKINNAFQFNGSTSINVTSLMGRPRGATLAAWAKLTTADSSGAEVISLGDSFAIRLDSGGNAQAFFYNGSSWPMVSYNQTYAGAGWHHFAAVFDDDHNFCRLYIDGIERGNLSTTASITYGFGANTVLGRHGNGSTIFDFSGWIDDARVYNRPLCATEVQRLYNGSAPVGVKIIKWVEIQ